MTGRELYEKYADIHQRIHNLNVDDWLDLGEDEQEAWVELAKVIS